MMNKTTLKEYAVTFALILAALYVVYQVFPASWRAKIVG